MKPHTDDLPDLPFDPTVISDSELMTLFSTYVSWQNYLATQLAEIESELHVLDATYDLEKAQAWNSIAGTATDKRVTVEGHDKVAKAKLNAMKCNHSVNLVKAELAASERNANLISRELSRRIGRESTHRRENKWGAN